MTAKFLLTGLLLALGVSACVPTPTPNALGAAILATETPAPASTLAPVPSATDRPMVKALVAVNVRQDPGGTVINWLKAGEAVTVIDCKDNWCKIERPFGWVFRGCLEGLNGELGCTSKEE